MELSSCQKYFCNVNLGKYAYLPCSKYTYIFFIIKIGETHKLIK